MMISTEISIININIFFKPRISVIGHGISPNDHVENVMLFEICQISPMKYLP